MDDKKQIEELAELIIKAKYCRGDCGKCKYVDDVVNVCTAKRAAEEILKRYQPKIPEGAVVIPKEVSCYENIEERVRTFKLDGYNVDFTHEQIMALTQILHYKEMNKNEIRKETAREFATTLISVIWEEEKGGTIRIKDVHGVIKDILNAQYGVEVE